MSTASNTRLMARVTDLAANVDELNNYKLIMIKRYNSFLTLALFINSSKDSARVAIFSTIHKTKFSLAGAQFKASDFSVLQMFNDSDVLKSVSRFL